MSYFNAVLVQLSNLQMILLVGSMLVVAAIGSLFFTALLSAYDEGNYCEPFEDFWHWFITGLYTLCVAVGAVMSLLGLIQSWIFTK